MSKSRTCLAAVCLALVFGLSGLTHGAAAVAQPQTSPSITLLVVIVVDQLRFDYLERYSRFWTAGFKRLMTEGAVFDRARYPYLHTITCPGHATIATGTFPYQHGVILNGWYSRDDGRGVTCTDDRSAKGLPYGPRLERAGSSARRLRMPTLADRLREASSSSRVVTLAMKPRSAIMLAGGAGTVTWFGENYVFATSTAYTQELVPEVKAFVDGNPIDKFRSTVWDRLRPVEEYDGSPENPHAHPDSGWTLVFPHPLSGKPGTRASRFANIWERSPYADAYIAEFAAHMVRAFALGQRDVVDYLGLSFSAVDSVGHDFGPFSHELQDTLARLDTWLGQLFSALDAAVGRDRYVVALSADHGVSDIPEVLAAQGVDAGRLDDADVAKAAEDAMAAAHGRGKYVLRANGAGVNLTDDARKRALADPAFVRPMIDAIERLPGVRRVFHAPSLATARDSADPLERAAALSYHPDTSADLLIALQPNWVFGASSAAEHGTANEYDQHVPVIVAGAPFAAGRYSVPASPADIAPTLAAIVNVPMPGVDGRVLAEAFAKER